jgi:hypothetical protein
MLYSKLLVILFVLSTSAMSCAAAQAHRYACPAFLTDGQVRYRLDTVDWFDGPPQELASLISVDTKYGSRLDVSNDDIYTICYYKGTNKTITVHSPGVSVCKVIMSPRAAWCE